MNHVGNLAVFKHPSEISKTAKRKMGEMGEKTECWKQYNNWSSKFSEIEL